MSCFIVHSPDGRVCLQVMLNDGKLFWKADQNGVTLVDESPIGIRLTGRSLTDGFALLNECRDTINETYQIPAFKKSSCQNHDIHHDLIHRHSYNTVFFF